MTKRPNAWKLHGVIRGAASSAGERSFYGSALISSVGPFCGQLLLLRSGYVPTPSFHPTSPNTDVSYVSHAKTAERMEISRQNPRSCTYCAPAESINSAVSSNFAPFCRKLLSLRSGYLPTLSSFQTSLSVNFSMETTRQNPKNCKRCGPAHPCFSCSVLHAATVAAQWLFSPPVLPPNITGHGCKPWIPWEKSRTPGNWPSKSEVSHALRTGRARKHRLRHLIPLCSALHAAATSTQRTHSYSSLPPNIAGRTRKPWIICRNGRGTPRN